MPMVRPDRTRSDGTARRHGSGLDHRALAITFAIFALFAGLVVFSGGDDGIWAAWAVGGYVVTAIALWRWPDSLAALLPALIFGLAAPLVWLTLRAPATPDVETVTDSAIRLVHHGTPYLPKAQLTTVLSYHPYFPAMTAFGLPKAAGLPGLLGDPRPWLALASAAVLAVAFGLGMPHAVARCASCRRSALRYAVLGVASPVLALSLAVGITDPPVLALMCLALALTAGRRPQPVLAGVAIGVACAMKVIAWPAVPVIAALLATRDGARAAARMCISSVVTAAVLVVALAPALLTGPSGFFQNTVLFPLGATPQHTPAASPLPGHLLASIGPAGRIAAVSLLVAVGLAVAASLVLRPPSDTRAATWRLAIGLALFFALAPAARFGYFAYPGALLGWLAITGRARGSAPGTTFEQITPAAAAPQGAAAAGTVTGTTTGSTAFVHRADTDQGPAAEGAGPSPARAPSPARPPSGRSPVPGWWPVPVLGSATIWIWLRIRRVVRSRRPATDSASGS